MNKRIARPFRAWDGEGVSRPGDTERAHRFTLLATNDDSIYDPDGLSTLNCFEFLLRPRERCINIWYYFDYDVNCILRDVPLRRQPGKSGSLKELALTGVTMWHGFAIHYIPGKIFRVVRHTAFESCDLSGFFQSGFIKACRSHGLDTALIERGKAERKDFWRWSKEDIVAYNQSELDLLVHLANILRDRLGAHSPARSWYGPGAIAGAWLKEKRIDTTPHYPTMMKDAVMRAYFGGRIDVARIGEIKDCHVHDLVSAYPAAMLRIPHVLEWERWLPIDEIHSFGLYLIEWNVDGAWGPFPWRTREGRVLYPLDGEGWYYGVEYLAALKLYPLGIAIREGWSPKTTYTNPLANNVRALFDARVRLKRAGDPSELAYKLILNSLYGKLAQKQQGDKKKPPFQNYLWAGFITAHTRAALLRAIALDPKAVIGCATDSIFATRNLLGTAKDADLGEWNYEGQSPMLIVMPGVYARIFPDGSQKYKMRGFPLPLNYGRLLRRWGCTTKLNTEGSESDEIEYQHFVTFRLAIARGLRKWGYFLRGNKGFYDSSMAGFGKRFPDPKSILAYSWKLRVMIPTPRPRTEGTLSHLYAIPSFEEEVSRDDEEVL